jgi:hypothetical protein
MRVSMLGQMTCAVRPVRCEWCSEAQATKANLCQPCHADFLASEDEGVELGPEDFEVERVFAAHRQACQ